MKGSTNLNEFGRVLFRGLVLTSCGLINVLVFGVTRLVYFFVYHTILHQAHPDAKALDVAALMLTTTITGSWIARMMVKIGALE